MPLMTLCFIAVSMLLLFYERYITVSALSLVFVVCVIRWQLPITPKDFKNVSELIPPPVAAASAINLEIEPERVSNVQRLRMMMASDDFGASDFEILGELDRDNNTSLLQGLSTSLIQGTVPATILQAEFDTECMICLEPQCENQEIRVLPCRHQYHAECIDLWLHRRSHCPMCKQQIIDEEEKEEKEELAQVQEG